MKYALLHRVGAAKFVPTNHTSNIPTCLGKFIYVVETKTNFDFGAYVFEQTMKHANSFAIKMSIAFPSLICGVILTQYPDILVSIDVASKIESSLSRHYKLFAGTHVPDIVVTSRQGAASSTSKEGLIEELEAMSKSLEETIKSITERKISVDKLILALPNQKEDKDMGEGNDHAACNKDEDVTGNNDDHQEESKIDA